MPLTRLQELEIDVKDKPPLDLSGLTALTLLRAVKPPVSSLPTSLVKCVATLQLDFDFSPFTNLTFLHVGVGDGVEVTCPTGEGHFQVFRNERLDSGE